MESIVPVETEQEIPKNSSGFDPAKSTISDRALMYNVYDNPDGSKTAVQKLEPVNAPQPDGSYTPIDLTLTTASSSDAPSAAKASVAGADMAPSTKAKNHPLKPVFGKDASTGAVAATSDGVSVSVTPMDAPKGAGPKKGKKPAGGSSETITYAKAAAGSDVTYELTEGSIKESIIVTAPPGETGAAAWSFLIAIDGADAAPVITESGAVEIRKADGSVVFGIPRPYAFDSAGISGESGPGETNGTFELEQQGKQWKLTVVMDRGWLNDPARVYPVSVDPTIAGTWYDAAVSYKTDGTTVQGQVKSGNPNESSGSANRWRGLAHFNISGWLGWGHQVAGAWVHIERTGGTANGYGQWLYHANALNYNGVGESLGGVNSYPDGADIGSDALTKFIRGQFNASSNAAYYMLRGDEAAGIYSYKTSNVALYVDLNVNAQAPTLSSPADGAVKQSVQTNLSINPSSDPEGDQIWYQYVVGTNADPGSAPVWISDWTTSTSVQVPSNKLQGGTTYYWRAYARDICHRDEDFCGYGAPFAGWWSGVRSFTTNQPPPGVGPYNTNPGDGAKVATTTPTLAVLPNGTPDPDGPQPLKYWFSIATGANGQTGVVISSGWINDTHWQVPEGYLKDGVTYTWRAWAYDGVDRDQSVWSNRITVDQRLGDPKSSPTDELGAATVNLANGNVVFSTESPTTAFATSSVALRYTYNSLAKPDEHGLTVKYFNDVNKNGQLDDGPDAQLMSKVEPVPTANWTGTTPLPGVIDQNYWIAQWTGYVTAPASGQYVFGGTNDDAIKVNVGGTDVYTKECCRAAAEFGTTSVQLEAGVPKPITITLSQITGAAYMDVQVKRADGAALWTGGPQVSSIPTGWLTTAPSSALPTGWTLSADLDEEPQYARAVVSQDSITVYDAAATPHIYQRAASGTTGGWNSPPGENSTLTIAGDGTVTLSDEDGSVTTFNKDGTPASYSPASGDAKTTIKNTYNGDGRLTTITDPVSDMKVTLKYGPDAGCYDSGWPVAGSGIMTQAPTGKLCRITYPNGTYTNLIYFEGSQQLAGILDPGTEFTNFGYDGNGKLWGIRDPLANDALASGKVPANESTSLLSYFPDGKIGAIESPVPTSGQPRQKHTYTYQSPPSGGADGVTLVNVAGINPASGYTSKVTFNADLRATSSTDALGRVTTTEYNSKDMLLKSTSKSVVNGQVTDLVTTTVYDAGDRPIAQYGPAAASCFSGYTPTAACAATVPTTTTAYDEGLGGLHVDWWKNASFAGQPDAKSLGIPGMGGGSSASWGGGAPAITDQSGAAFPADSFSLRASGYLTFTAGGTYNFAFTSDDGAQVWIDNQLQATANFSTPATFTIPDVPGGAVVPIRIQYTENSGNAAFNLQWQPPGGSMQTIPTSALSPGYGLATTQTTKDSGGATPEEVVKTDYGSKPWDGMPAAVTQDPGGLSLTTSYTYDALKRRTGRTLPSGSTYTDTYYGNTETRVNPCAPGTTAINQGGRLKTNTTPAAKDGYQLVREYVYDAMGRIVASRVQADGDAGWTCSTYDARGRAITMQYPATKDDASTPGVNEATPGRTVTNDYAVGGDPRASSINDPAGTITTVVDLNSKTTKYTDATGVVTTTSYDAAGRPSGESTTSGTSTSKTTFTYDDASQITQTLLDNQAVSTATIDSASGVLTAASYGNGTSLQLTRGPGGQLASLTWNIGGRAITSTVTRSQSGRVTTDQATDSGDPASGYNWSYSYDKVGRLTTANLATQGPRPAVGITHGFDTSTAAAGCSTAAGKNSNRANETRAIAGTPQPSTSYCYDNADRIQSSTAGQTYFYDKHGNTTKVTNANGGEVTIFVYDSADRHVKTITPNGSGSTSTVTYTRDATGRIISHQTSGSATASENGTVSYGFSASGDSPDIYLGNGGVIGSRVLGLDGGATYSKDYTDATKSIWAYPNIHGDNIATSIGSGGQLSSPIVTYDPYGTPITTAGAADADAGPNTAPGSFDPGWLGQHLRYAEHTAGLNYIQMGQRVYDTHAGRFAAVDPIEGGSANDYDYVNADPLNTFDLDGTRPVKLKKGQKLSCGKGRYAYSYATYNGTYWDCASKASRKAKSTVKKTTKLLLWAFGRSTGKPMSKSSWSNVGTGLGGATGCGGFGMHFNSHYSGYLGQRRSFIFGCFVGTVASLFGIDPP